MLQINPEQEKLTFSEEINRHNTADIQFQLGR